MKNDRQSPPRFILSIFRWYCDPRLAGRIEGDLCEEYVLRLKKYGKRKADIKIIIDVVLLFRPAIIRSGERNEKVNTYSMLKSYLKIGWRNVVRNKGYSLINIGGLAMGMAIAIFIGLWVADELSFNHGHRHYRSIAQVLRKETREEKTFVSGFQTTGLAALLKSDYGTHFDAVVLMNTRPSEAVLASGTNKFTQRGYFMQAGGADLFSLKMLAGDQHGFKNKNSIILSHTLATKIFDDRDPINQVLSFDANVSLTVTGVYEDLPGNSELKEASFFAPIELYADDLNTWNNYNVGIYVQLKDATAAEAISSLIKDVAKTHIPSDRKQEIFLHSMNKWHLNSEFENGKEITSGRMMAVWYNSLIGVFIMLLACINFMNLSTARSEHRAKEVGIRKAIGSVRRQLIQQFYSESFMVSVFSVFTALLVVALSLPWFNTLAGKNLSVPWINPLFWLTVIAFVFICSLLAGSYPALYLSSFNPMRALKGKANPGNFALSSRKVLVVFQFTVSVLLTICTIVVYQQIKHTKDRPVGYSRENLLGLRAVSAEFAGKYDVLRNKLKATGAVEEMAEANYSITETLGSNDGFSWLGKVYDQPFNTIVVTPEYGKTVGWEFVKGRDFSRDVASDSSGVIINESALKVLGIPEPVGELLHWDYDDNVGANYKILGVVKDMVKGSPYAPTEPSIIFHSKADLFWLYIRLRPDINPHEATQKIAAVFEELVPSASFDFRFADAEYDAKFQSEERTMGLATVFSSFAALISCLGLIGLAAYAAEKRSKEIGIRKVLGASAVSLWTLMTKDFMILVIVACVVAIPFAHYFMTGWLGHFDYRVEISPWLYFITGTGTLVITLITVSFLSVKAALMNPVKSLRTE